METIYTWQIVIVIAVVTAMLRFLPFIIFRSHTSRPTFITKLSQLLPYAIMGMLVVYCLKDTTFNTVSSFLPQLIACVVAILLHVWKRNTLISIVCSTVCYMVLVQIVF